MRLFVAFLAYLCLWSPALAEVPMANRLCTQSSAADVTAESLLQSGNAFDCSDSKYALDGPRVWVKIPFLADRLPPGSVEVQGDNNGLTTMQVHAQLDDGSLISSSFSEQQVIDSWRPKGHYGLPVPGSENPELRNRITHVYIAIDNPKVVSSMSLIQLASKDKWDGLKLPLSIMFGVLCGMVIMPLFYHIFFYAALRYSFMLWHSAMIAATVAYTFSSSGLMFLAFPETSLLAKMLINYWALAIAVAASGFFLIRFIEPGKIAPWLRNGIILSSVLPVFVTAFVLRIDEGYDMDARNYYHASFLPAFFIVLYAMGHALRRGSKAIWFQIAGWTPIVFFGLDRVARGMDLYIGWPALDYGLYFALVLETIILALGVANRIWLLRQKHENTLRKQVELTLLADTDGLTMMNNRRSFEREYRRNQRDRRYSHLAIIDIDFFKRVNDRYGHEVGDEVLRVVGRQLDGTGHFAARIGGEEFTLLIKDKGRDKRRNYPANVLTEICETLIMAVHEEVPEIREPVTFSVGVASLGRRDSLRSAMATADRRLYDAKKNGRNQIVWIDISSSGPVKPAGTASV
ncbi:sensor domain-containing diguanylate cyclase [Sphingorhabdus sp. 109]|uniref:sensor domain-containing diguanylate cyclase n=1 Tax=Sphingorhabdus sp. 109 TaxID=2653173 RepID=UPI0012EF9B35|nr:diguanylate cyclase [Sphingorhabdus sp. 109]VWX59155.1 putative diguanylate cyclase AdrA [Sphingorhabdus sp. 109]